MKQHENMGKVIKYISIRVHRWNNFFAASIVVDTILILCKDLHGDYASGSYRVVKLNHNELDPASSRAIQGLFLQLHPDRGHDPADLSSSESNLRPLLHSAPALFQHSRHRGIFNPMMQ